MSFQIPKPHFEPHPAGRHQGRITEVRDKGIVQTQYGDKHKVMVIIESMTEEMDDGRPFLITKTMSLSSGRNSTLRAFREAVLDRPLTTEELQNFNAQRELVGQEISFRVDHSEPDAEGNVFANIRDGSIEPTGAANSKPHLTPTNGQRAPARAATPSRQPVAAGRAQNGQEPDFSDVPPPQDSDLPFSLAFLIPFLGAASVASSLLS